MAFPLASKLIVAPLDRTREREPLERLEPVERHPHRRLRVDVELIREHRNPGGGGYFLRLLA